MSHQPCTDTTGLPNPPGLSGSHAGSATLTLATMRVTDLHEVDAAERIVYEHPWTLGNFKDSIVSGYECWVARDGAGSLAGYFLLMTGPDEAHLLNITVVPGWQGAGIGRRLLEHAFKLARCIAIPAVLLEVRPSNPRAIAIYRHVGFREIGIRKGYYPAAGPMREDAIVMRRDL